jgi:hypothetical protein
VSGHGLRPATRYNLNPACIFSNDDNKRKAVALGLVDKIPDWKVGAIIF